MLPFRYAKADVPYQFNDYDCGLFVILYCKMWFKNKDSRLKMEDSDGQLDGKLSKWFVPKDVFNLRYKNLTLAGDFFAFSSIYISILGVI